MLRNMYQQPDKELQRSNKGACVLLEQGPSMVALRSVLVPKLSISLKKRAMSCPLDFFFP